MGLFNRNKQEKDALPVAAAPAPPPATTTTLPPSSPPRQQADTSVYSETTKSTNQTVSTSYHPEEDAIHEDDDEDFDEEEAHKATTWDEGGASHCGYSESVHETLMKVGASVHKVVGEPPQFLEARMNIIANWFQEMSYAVRDFTRGESKMTDDIADVMNSVMQDEDEHEAEGDGLHHDDDDAHAATTPAVTAN